MSVKDPGERLKTAGNQTFFYDSCGRMILATYKDSVVARTEYTYTKDSLSVSSYDTQGRTQPLHQVFFLDKNGLATGARYVISSNTVHSSDRYVFRYDKDNHLTEQSVTTEETGSMGHTVFYFHDKGDIDSARVSSLQPGNQLREAAYYEYYTDRTNWLSNPLNGILFAGNGSYHLLKKETIIAFGTTVKEYTYDFDAQGRVIARHTLLNGQQWEDLNYTWY